jgi:hypothetical protein
MRPSEDPNQKIVKSATDARQGVRSHGVFSVLTISTIGAFLACLIVYLVFFG